MCPINELRLNLSARTPLHPSVFSQSHPHSTATPTSQVTGRATATVVLERVVPSLQFHNKEKSPDDEGSLVMVQYKLMG